MSESDKKKPMFAVAAAATVAEGEEDEEDEAPAPAPQSKPIIPVAVTIVSGEEDEDEEPSASTVSHAASADSVAAAQPSAASTSSAVVLEGGADEEDGADTKEAYTTMVRSKAVSPEQTGLPSSSTGRKLNDANQAARKGLAKRIVTMYDGTKRELAQTSESVNSSLRSAQDVWDMSISLNTKLRQLDEKLGTLQPPLML